LAPSAAAKRTSVVEASKQIAGASMGTWLARVHFPNGRVRYARYSTVMEEVYDDLFDHCRAKGETDELGNVCHRGEVQGEPSPADLSKSLSQPGDIIPVRIEVEPDGMTWPALYCSRQNRIVGPHSKFFADTLQQTFNLILRDNRLHLVHASGEEWPRRDRGAESDGHSRAQTLCGEPAAGEITPFLRVYYPGKPEDPSEPAPRNLYGEWRDGVVCRRCLLHNQALNPRS
jgi:hypothetical protein